MKIPWGQIASVATRVGMKVLTGVPMIETLAGRVTSAKGAEKRAAILDLVQAELALCEDVAGRDLASDPDVLRATGALIDAYVALHNLLARKRAPAAG